MPSAGSAIQYKTLNQLVQVQLDYITANAPIALSKPLGPFITAIAFSVALVALVLQRLVQLALAAARLSTATGADIDSFVEDFGLSRLPAVAASGQVTFARFTPAPAQILVPVGSIVQTSSVPPVQYQVVQPFNVKTTTAQGSATTFLKVASTFGFFNGDTIAVDGFTITGAATITVTDGTTLLLTGTLNAAPGAGVTVTDLTLNPSFDPVAQAYKMTPNLSSVIAAVQALIAGTSGNAAAGAINKIGSSTPGIDTVTNSLAFSNGLDLESDAAVQARFALFILGLSKATKVSISSAVSNVQQGLLYNVIETFATTTIAGSVGTTLKVVTTVGMSINDTLSIGGIAQTFVIQAIVDSQTLTLTASLPTPAPAAGASVADLSVNPGGSFSVAVDDGSGAITTTLVAQVAAAVELVRPIGVRAIVAATSVTQLAVAARVTYPAANVPNVLSFQLALRNAVLAQIDALRPGDKLHYATLYRTIFNALSPGDVVSTAIAVLPISTTTVLQVGTTIGMRAGQIVQVDSITAASGALPTIKSIDSDTQLTLAIPLVSAPTAGAAVTTFSQTSDQVRDVHSLQLNVIAASTTFVLAGSSSTTFKVASSTGMVANQLMIITDESTTPPTYYQLNPTVGALPTINSVPDGTSFTFVDAAHTVGTINAAGAWTAALPPTGAKIIALAAAGADITPGQLTALRLKALAPNALLIQVEPE